MEHRPRRIHNALKPLVVGRRESRFETRHDRINVEGGWIDDVSLNECALELLQDVSESLHDAFRTESDQQPFGAWMRDEIGERREGVFHNSKCKMQNSKCKIQNAKRKMQD